MTPYPPASASFSIWAVLLLAREVGDMISLSDRLSSDQVRVMIDWKTSLDGSGGW